MHLSTSSLRRFDTSICLSDLFVDITGSQHTLPRISDNICGELLHSPSSCKSLWVGGSIGDGGGGSQSKRMYCDSIRCEIYKAYPWLGPAQLPTETDEFVAIAGVAPDRWFSSAATETAALQYRQRFHYVLKKCLSKKGCGGTRPLSFQQRRSLSSCWIAVISAHRLVNGFCASSGERQVRLLSSHGPAKISASTSTQTS